MRWAFFQLWWAFGSQVTPVEPLDSNYRSYDEVGLTRYIRSEANLCSSQKVTHVVTTARAAVQTQSPPPWCHSLVIGISVCHDA